MGWGQGGEGAYSCETIISAPGYPKFVEVFCLSVLAVVI